MMNMTRIFIYLLICHIYIVNIHSYSEFKFLHDDDEINEILIENIHNRAKRAVTGNSTIVYDGSGFSTSKNREMI